MKNFKRVLALILACLMVIPSVLTVSASSFNDDLASNWKVMAAKYSSRSKEILTSRDAEDFKNGRPFRTDNFTFTEDTASNGGISVVTPPYADVKDAEGNVIQGGFAGIYGVSAVSSKNKTSIDGLTVVVRPDDFDFMIDNLGASNNISILWTEEKIDNIAGYDIVTANGKESVKTNGTGLDNYEKPGTNGFRHLIPTVDDGKEGVPASDKSVQTNGKALCITVSNDYGPYSDTKTASNVSIVYYDGHYINKNDHHPGYRWVFTARNSPQTLRADSSGISSNYEEIDLTYGLAVSVRADEKCGYIVNINGKDYYKGIEVGYFPDAYKDGYSLSSTLTDEDYVNRTEKYVNSMSWIEERKDIDLTGLRNEDGSGLEGYLTVGVSSNNDQTTATHRANYTVAYVNGVPASQWDGSNMDPNHKHDYKLTDRIEPDCEKDGAEIYTCACGASYSNSIKKLGHDYVINTEQSKDATCTEDGIRISKCSRCGQNNKEVIKAFGHDFDDYFVKVVATPETDGTMAAICKTCGEETTKSYKYSTVDEVVDDWEFSGVNGYSITNPNQQLVNIDINDDKSITVKDASLQLDANASNATITKAINKNKISLENFELTIKPEAVNSKYPDVYPDNLNLHLTTDYNKYNTANEYSIGSLNTEDNMIGVPREEWKNYGSMWGGCNGTERTITLTLMDSLNNGGQVTGNAGDGYYDAVFWAVSGKSSDAANSSFWGAGKAKLDTPIKMGDEIRFNVIYELNDPENPSLGYYLAIGVNANDEELTNYVELTSMGNGQTTRNEYYFAVTAQSDAKFVGNDESISASSYTILDVCGENPVDFDGYVDEHEHVFADEGTVTKAPTCKEEGVRTKVCTYCGLSFDEVIPADENAHVKEWKITKEPTCIAEGEKQEVCTVCGEVFATETVEKVDHTPAEEWKVTEAEHPYLEEGKKELLCTVCGEVLKTEVIPVKEYVKPTDVVAAWYESQVEYCVKHGLMTGMSGTTFGVSSTLTRDQFILILARLANVDENAYKGGEIGFGDVPADHWGAWAIKWAHDEKITAGVGNGNFGVGQSLVREQFAVLIYSYMEKVGKDIKIDDAAIANFRKYEDINNVSSWAVDGVTWAMSKGIIGSMVTERFVFSPKSNVTRAQAAVMIRNIHSDGLFD